MEIRRKVFSLLEDENGEERYYSTTEFELEFDEETGEKLFSEKEDSGKGKKIALGVTGAAAATVGALELANILKKRKLTPEQKKALEGMLKANGGDRKAKYVKDQVKYWRSANKATQNGIGFVEKGNKWVADTAKKVLETGKSGLRKGKEKVKSVLKKKGEQK